MAGGLLEAISGFGLCVTTFETGVGIVAGGAILTNGIDHLETGLQKVWSGQEHNTSLNHELSDGGLSERNANLIELGVNLIEPAGLLAAGKFDKIGTMFTASSSGYERSLNAQLGGNGFKTIAEKLVPESTVFYSKTAEEMALELRSEIGQNSVTFKTVNRTGHIDLAGKAHYDRITKKEVPTPHVQTYDIHAGPNGKMRLSRKSETITPATKTDTRIARRLAKNQGLIIQNKQSLINRIPEFTIRRPSL